MTQQEQMLTAAQNELSHAPLIHLYMTSVTCCQQFSCLSSRQEMGPLAQEPPGPAAVPLSNYRQIIDTDDTSCCWHV